MNPEGRSSTLADSLTQASGVAGRSCRGKELQELQEFRSCRMGGPGL